MRRLAPECWKGETVSIVTKFAYIVSTHTYSNITGAGYTLPLNMNMLNFTLLFPSTFRCFAVLPEIGYWLLQW